MNLKHFKQSRRKWVLAGGALGILLFLFLLTRIFGGESDDDASASLTYTASFEPFTISISESGTIESRNRVVVKSLVQGQQTIIFLKPEGSIVQSGDLLVELDSSALKDKLTEEEIELENAEAELIAGRENLAVVENQAEADISQAKLDFEFAKQDLAKYREGEFAMSLKKANSKITLARAELQQSEDRLNGSTELYEKRYISETELESDQLAKQRAQMDLELALQEKQLLETFTYNRQIAQLESDVEQAELALERAERKARANIAQAEARFSARRAEVQREQVSTKDLRTRIENCQIRAPTAGMVVYAPQGNRWDASILEEGMSVRERQDLIYLPTATEMSAQISVHESMMNKLEVGQIANITVDALPGVKFTGTVTTIAVMPEDGGWRNPDLKQYKTELFINEEFSALRSGMTCKADILVAYYDEALTVPLQSVLRVDDQSTVYTRGRNGIPMPQVIEVGMDNNRKVRVISGLEAGTEVLLNPPLAEAERGNEGFEAPTDETAEKSPAQQEVRQGS
jgi:HlyD family secretion protein